MTPEQLEGFTQASDPQFSPDGRHVSYVVSRIDLAGNRYQSRIWVVPTDQSAPPRPLSAGEHRDGQPRWSPDGRTLAFTSTRKVDATGNAESTLHLMPFDVPGETVLLHAGPERMSQLVFSPDGGALAFIMRTRSKHYSETDPSAREPRKIENLMFMLNGEGFINDRPSHLYLAELDGTGDVRNLTPGTHEVGQPAWFPDGTQLAVAIDLLRSREASAVATVDLDGNLVLRTHEDSSVYSPVVSADGAQLVAVGHDDADTMFENLHVGVFDPAASGQRGQWLTKSLDRHWLPFMTGQSPTWDSANGLLAAAEDRGNIHLYRVDPSGTDPVLMVGGDRSVTGWSTGTIDGAPAIAFAATDRVTPNEISLQVDGDERRLTHVSKRWTSVTGPVNGEHFLAQSGDLEVDAWLYRPKDFDASKSYPMLLNIHGGPFTQYGNYFFDEFQLQADAGYVVVCANPRGGSGRENDWGAAIRGPKHKNPGAGWGSLDYDDLMAVVDEAISKYSFIDTDRLGVLGGSYGGYMTSWIVSHTNRFAAACSERSANNLLSLEYGSDVAGYFSAEMGPRHYEDPSEYLRMSPVSYVKDINTPLLIVHSENDLRCPVEQATQLFVSMKLLEKEVEYWLFPNESHELTRSGSPVHRKRRAEIILEFFNRQLQPDL